MFNHSGLFSRFLLALGIMRRKSEFFGSSACALQRRADPQATMGSPAASVKGLSPSESAGWAHMAPALRHCASEDSAGSRQGRVQNNSCRLSYKYPQDPKKRPKFTKHWFRGCRERWAAVEPETSAGPPAACHRSACCCCSQGPLRPFAWRAATPAAPAGKVVPDWAACQPICLPAWPSWPWPWTPQHLHG